MAGCMNRVVRAVRYLLHRLHLLLYLRLYLLLGACFSAYRPTRHSEHVRTLGSPSHVCIASAEPRTRRGISQRAAECECVAAVRERAREGREQASGVLEEDYLIE